MSSCHEDAKRDTIKVARGTNAKLPHFTGHALSYPTENEMSLVHHVVEQWGCNYTNKDSKGLNERTQ
jgi:hypothetical protein